MRRAYPPLTRWANEFRQLRWLEPIDASAVDTDLLGHGYYAENRSVRSDIHNLLVGGASPKDRFGMRQSTRPAMIHWEFVP